MKLFYLFHPLDREKSRNFFVYPQDVNFKTWNDWDQSNSLVVDDIGYAYETGNSAQSNEGADCVTIKYDSSGNLKWVGIFGIGNSFNQFGEVVKIDNLWI